MSFHFIVLFTTQKIQKVKKWKDGIGIYSEDKKKFELYEEVNGKKQLITSETIKKTPSVGDIIEVDKFLIDIDSVQSEETNPQIDKTNAHNTIPICSRVCTGMKKRKTSLKPLLTTTPRSSIIKTDKQKNSIKELIDIFEGKEISQEQHKKINKQTGCIKKELGRKGFKVPKAMEKIEFPKSLIDSEEKIERIKRNKESSQGIYTNIGKYVTDMNNIVVNEINYRLAEIGQMFYTIVDTQAIEMGGKGRISICSHGVAIRQICHKEGINKGRGFYCCPEHKCKAFQWDKEGINKTELRYKLPEAIDRKIEMKELNVKIFEEQGIIVFLDVEVFQSKKLVPTPEDPESTKTIYFMKINDIRKVKELKKDDLWILLPQEYPYSLNSKIYIVTSLYHGPTKDGLIGIEFITPTPTNFKRINCIALRGFSGSTEVLILQTLVQLSITPIHLLSSLMQYLIFHKFTPTKYQPLPDIQIIKEYNLNNEQIQVIEEVIQSLQENKPPLTLVHGVFGSGKSHLLSVLCILLASLNYKVLVCASTNVAVDRVLESLLTKNYKSFFRVGSLKKISKQILPFTLSENDGLNDLRELKKEKLLTNEERRIIENEINERKSGSIEKRSHDIKTASIVGVTCASSTNPILNNSYDIILLDEATQTIEPMLLIPILRFNPKCIVCVGDPMQLDPVLQTDHLSATLFQRLCSLEIPIMLKVQYRCCPPISNIVNRLYYNGNLQNGANVYNQHSLIPSSNEIILCYHDIDDEKILGSSYYSHFELCVVNQIISILSQLLIPLNRVGVISFYKQQCEYLASSISQKEITVATIDAFQGAEKDIILLSFVRNKHSSFLESAKRLNVALTRARNNLIFIMHKNILQDAFIQNLFLNTNVSYIDCDVLLHSKQFIFE
ncbi:hypothetical protein ENUP19_0052G0011 [Entamoeba nuttalli]|uniref:Regulator of nonsense transcripts, putative n=2 Tax=Entamoeba nuttalli TaxID=412467 RepID=K2H871_ENTNP|nr:regulator of nonsense transcripts, putative [Entamoeba nuttalli P19]EKE42812.1 regulator of nonsense transcripts, putative [Entamoeba nuttalli P19]|eukprot:XP_008854855.1 regulator of nonsense transcripts, putative [Entamoeba nuttalli P19]